MNTEKLYEDLTKIFLDSLNEGQVPWQKPWKSQHNIVSGKEYKGINQIVLSIKSERNEWSNKWATFNQIKSSDGSIKAGSKATTVVFWKMFERKTEVEGKKVSEFIPSLKYFNVFNFSQTTGIDEGKFVYEQPKEEIHAEAVASKYLTRENIVVKTKSKAFYSPSEDYIGMPRIGTFTVPEEYFPTLFHEIIHSTGHESRLKRREADTVHAFGDENYSKEELIAEIGSAFLCSKTNVSNEHTLRNSKAYIQSWASVLKKNPKWIMQASSKAQKAVEFVLNGKVEKAGEL